MKNNLIMNKMKKTVKILSKRQKSIIMNQIAIIKYNKTCRIHPDKAHPT